MAAEREFDLLDDYLTNRLSGKEKEAFEKSMEGDTALKSEFQFQQNLVEGIKNARIAELKTMLNNTPIPPVQGTMLLGKIAASIIVTGIISTGIYFYFTKEEQQEISNQQHTVKSKPSETASQNQKPLVEKNVIAKTESTTEKTSDKKIVVDKPAVDSNQVPTEVSEIRNADYQKPDVFDPASEMETAPNVQKEVVKIKTDNVKVVASTIEVKTDNTNKKYLFHYQFKNEKLFLYGSFEKNLYEIMEFFSGDKRTVFLFYKDNYYLLSEADEKIKPLSSINDPVLQQKLKEYRAAK